MDPQRTQGPFAGLSTWVCASINFLCFVRTQAASLRRSDRRISTASESKAIPTWRDRAFLSACSRLFRAATLYAAGLAPFTIPRARARARRVVPISVLVFGALTQNRSGLEPSLGFAAIARRCAGLNGASTARPIVDHARYVQAPEEPMRDPKRFWRIRPDVSVVPVPPPVRKINSKGAGNRGKSKRRLKTTPVLG